MKDLIKGLESDSNHLFFWIQDHCLYQTYQTIRGKRYRKVTNDILKNWNDTERLDKDQIKVAQEFLKNYQLQTIYFCTYELKGAVSSVNFSFNVDDIKGVG